MYCRQFGLICSRAVRNSCQNPSEQLLTILITASRINTMKRVILIGLQVLPQTNDRGAGRSLSSAPRTIVHGRLAFCDSCFTVACHFDAPRNFETINVVPSDELPLRCASLNSSGGRRGAQVRSADSSKGIRGRQPRCVSATRTPMSDFAVKPSIER
jgi:hypothetical protein